MVCLELTELGMWWNKGIYDDFNYVKCQVMVKISAISTPLQFQPVRYMKVVFALGEWCQKWLKDCIRGSSWNLVNLLSSLNCMGWILIQMYSFCWWKKWDPDDKYLLKIILLIGLEWRMKNGMWTLNSLKSTTYKSLRDLISRQTTV